MITTAVPRKVLPQPERMAALAAVAAAKAKHEHVGIRPKKQREAEKKTSGILVPPGTNAATGVSQALRRAGAAWPEENSWQVFGSDDFGEFPNETSCRDALGDGCFGDPLVYGEFETVDEPGWMGGYPV